MILIFKKTWKEIEGLKAFLIFALFLFLKLIGSSLSLLLCYSLSIVFGIWLLIYIKKRKRENKKTSGIFYSACVFFTLYSFGKLISELLTIFTNDHIDNLSSLLRQMDVYNTFILSITAILFGLVLISKQALADMGWLKGKVTNKKKERGLVFLKILGFFLISAGVVLAVFIFYIYFIQIPNLQHYGDGMRKNG